jgi:AraC-like DNA-binding protein
MDHRIRIAVERLHANISTRVSVAALARSVNMSRWRFSHLFKDEMSLPVSHYIAKLRMREARRMLSETLLTVKEIRAHLGNIDRSHFSREFKKCYGFTPTEFRKRFDKPKS